MGKHPRPGIPGYRRSMPLPVAHSHDRQEQTSALLHHRTRPLRTEVQVPVLAQARTEVLMTEWTKSVLGRHIV